MSKSADQSVKMKFVGCHYTTHLGVHQWLFGTLHVFLTVDCM